MYRDEPPLFQTGGKVKDVNIKELSMIFDTETGSRYETIEVSRGTLKASVQVAECEKALMVFNALGRGPALAVEKPDGTVVLHFLKETKSLADEGRDPKEPADPLPYN